MPPPAAGDRRGPTRQRSSRLGALDPELFVELAPPHHCSDEDRRSSRRSRGPWNVARPRRVGAASPPDPLTRPSRAGREEYAIRGAGTPRRGRDGSRGPGGPPLRARSRLTPRRSPSFWLGLVQPRRPMRRSTLEDCREDLVRDTIRKCPPTLSA